MAAIMKFLLCVALVLALFHQNDGRSIIRPFPSRHLHFQCGRGRVMSGIRSSLFARRADRWFHFRCSTWKLPTGRCYWTFPSAFRNDFSASCKCGHVLSGMRSVFSFKQRDRKYSFRCCAAKDVESVDCHSSTGRMMKQFSLDVGYFRTIGTVNSRFTCLGRKFSFEVCRLKWKIFGGPVGLRRRLWSLSWWRLKKLAKSARQKLRRIYRAIRNAGRRKKRHLWKIIMKIRKLLRLIRREVYRRWHRRLRRPTLKGLKQILKWKRISLKHSRKRLRKARRKLKRSRGKWRRRWLRWRIKRYRRRVKVTKYVIRILIKLIKKHKGYIRLRKLSLLKLKRLAKLTKRKIRALLRKLRRARGNKRKRALWKLIRKAIKWARSLRREIYRRWRRKLRRLTMQGLKLLLRRKRISLKLIRKLLRKARRKLKRTKGKWRRLWLRWRIKRYRRRVKVTMHVIRILIKLIKKHKGYIRLRKLSLLKLKRLAKLVKQKIRALLRKLRRARGNKRKRALWKLIRKAIKWARSVKREIYRRWHGTLRLFSVKRLKLLLKWKRISLKLSRKYLRRARRKLKKAKGKWARQWYKWWIKRYIKRVQTAKYIILLLKRRITQVTRGGKRLTWAKLNILRKKALRELKLLGKKLKRTKTYKKKRSLCSLIKRKTTKSLKFIVRAIYRWWHTNLKQMSVKRLRRHLKLLKVLWRKSQKHVKALKKRLQKAKGRCGKKLLNLWITIYKEHVKAARYAIRSIKRLIKIKISREGKTLWKVSWTKLKKMVKKAWRTLKSYGKRLKHAKSTKRRRYLWKLIRKVQRRLRLISWVMHRRWRHYVKHLSYKQLKNLRKWQKKWLKKIRKNAKMYKRKLQKAKGKWKRQWLQMLVKIYSMYVEEANYEVQIVTTVTEKVTWTTKTWTEEKWVKY